jgi:chemotaxis methyl-accepting protein methylase
MEAERTSLEDDNAIERITAILGAAMRVDFSEYRRSTIERRIRQRMLTRHLSDLGEYARLLEKDPDAVSDLYDRLLILTTSFFRDPESFEVLKKRFLPRLFGQRKEAGTIRVWSAGCSTGEEAYSIAILLLEVAADAGGDVPIHVFASDLSEPALARARGGTYAPKIAEDVSAARLERFFTRTDDGYRVRGAVRDVCSFARHGARARSRRRRRAGRRSHSAADRRIARRDDRSRGPAARRAARLPARDLPRRRETPPCAARRSPVEMTPRRLAFARRFD